MLPVRGCHVSSSTLKCGLEGLGIKLDKRIRKNEICIINLPSCDYVFSSTRSCFIAYGFRRSQLEMAILQNIVKERGIECYEAGGSFAPAQFAFCTKICSKIITSQFCIVLLNSDTEAGVEKPNANVNMEYGLMLGFNKYIIPFQHNDYHLPFNVAALDTIKYDNTSFSEKAAKAIDQAIFDTKQDTPSSVAIGQDVGAYLLLRGAIVSPIDTPGDKALYQLGAICSFNLCIDFEGNSYTYFGNFATLRPEVIVWRIKKLHEIVKARIGGSAFRQEHGMITPQQQAAINKISDRLQIWIHTNSEDARSKVLGAIDPELLPMLSIFTTREIATAVVGSGMY
jgi:hypothetical protein